MATFTELADDVRAVGGVMAPAAATARLRDLLARGLAHGRIELLRSRSGYDDPVTVAFAQTRTLLMAATPADAALRADPQVVNERSWLLVAGVVGALAQLAGQKPMGDATDAELLAGTLAPDFLVLAVPAPAAEPADLEELAPVAFDDQAGRIDRLRARAVAVPAALLDSAAAGLSEPVGPRNPLRVAEAVARLAGRPADPASVLEHEDGVLALIGDDAGWVARPHEDPQPARRIARRILQRLDGMGKWGGYHTEFAHLARGFAGNERALAQAVGHALLTGGLLAEKPSAGQRHVFLNPRRAGDIRRLIETGQSPAGLELPAGRG